MKGFPAVVNKSSKVLIVATFPSAESLKVN